MEVEASTGSPSATGLPVTLGYVDQATRTTGLGPTLTLTGDVRADMDLVRAFYADKAGHTCIPPDGAAASRRVPDAAARLSPAPPVLNLAPPATPPPAGLSRRRDGSAPGHRCQDARR